MIIIDDMEVVDVVWVWLGGVGFSFGYILVYDIIKYGGIG